MHSLKTARKLRVTLVLVGTIFVFSGCATESHRVIEAPKTFASTTSFSGARLAVSIGNFENRSPFMRGLFSDGVDRLGGQAKTILVAHLNQSQRFSVLDRENMAAAQQEAKIQNKALATKGATYLVTGDVTEFGRKEIGDHQLFGILGRGKEQVAYAKVTINVVRVDTSEVVFSTQGAGEYALSNREIIGFGGTASYDSTLNGKVLDLAIREAVEKLSNAVDMKQIK
jgi:curli biogenesis system outer membrane secretion channel CsgG